MPAGPIWTILQPSGKLMTARKVYISPAALKEIDQLPGHIRQRVRRAILDLRTNPFPPVSKKLVTGIEGHRESWRIRIDRWRILYAVNPASEQILVVAVRQRPPYQYDDLELLLSDLD